MKLHATIGWHDFWSRDHYIKNVTSHFSQRYTWYYCFMSRDLYSFLYSYMSFLYVMWSRNLLKLHSPTSKKTINTKLGSITYKNERVAYLHMTWVNHAKVIKATAPKVALMKGTNLNSPREFWLYDTLTNEKSICNFYKSC